MWAEATMLAGLELGQPGSGPGALLMAGPEGWTLLVRDRGGTVHEVALPPPTDAQGREEIAFLAASLLEPIAPAAPAPVPAPEPPARPVPSPRPPVPAALPDPDPAPAPAPAPETAPAPAATVSVPPSRLRLSGGPLARLSATHRPSSGFSLSGAWTLPRRTRAGLTVRLGTASGLRGQPELRVVSATELAAQAGAEPWARVPLELGLELGLSHRRYSEGELQVATATIPTLGLLASGEWYLRSLPVIGLRPWLVVTEDLRRVRIREEGDDGELAARTVLQAGLELTWRAAHGRGPAPTPRPPAPRDTAPPARD